VHQHISWIYDIAFRPGKAAWVELCQSLSGSLPEATRGASDEDRLNVT
jgi:hypothetical protein